MDIKKKTRKIQPSSSSDSSSSDSSEDDRRKKHRMRKQQQRESSSSSEEEEVPRKSHKHAAHKSASVRKHSHSAKLRAKLVASSGKKTRSLSPASRAAHKHHLKKKAKLAHMEDHERRSRSPTRRDVKKDRTPDHHRITSPTTRIRVSVPNNRATTARGVKESPSRSRRHVREPASEKERAEILARCQERQRERERVRRAQEEEERYKHSRTRVLEKHHHERSRSRSRGKIPIRERLDKEYEYRRSISREHEDFQMIRPSGRDRERMEPERNFDYRGDDRRIADYPPNPRSYEDRGHRGWEGDEPPRSSRIYDEGRDWETSKRISEDPRDRIWPEEKWPLKEKEPKEWSRSWKDSGPSGPPISHGRRWPGSSDSWNPRKMDPSAPPFKPRFGGSSSHFGFKRFPPFKRFPNQYSKINFPSKRVIPSTTETSTSASAQLSNDDPGPTGTSASDSEHLSRIEAMESGEIATEPEEDKVEADTTTVGGNVETQSQEEGEEGNLSEFSDVDDDILNREEELARGAASGVNTPAEGDNDNGDQEVKKIFSKIHANKELKKEMNLDFEEISDGELEEESRIKGLGDALGVDWASLAKETQRPVKSADDELINSTKFRWTPHRILWDVGVSVKMAGEDFARKVLLEARDKLRQEKAERRIKLEQMKTKLTNGDVKQEGAVDEGADEVKVKIEPKDEEDETMEEEKPDVVESEEDFELETDVLSHPLAQVQVLMRDLQKKRKNLILNSSMKYGRALSARRDLKIRRALCNLPAQDIKIDRSCCNNPEIQKNVDAMFRKMVEGVS